MNVNSISFYFFSSSRFQTRGESLKYDEYYEELRDKIKWTDVCIF